MQVIICWVTAFNEAVLANAELLAHSGHTGKMVGSPAVRALQPPIYSCSKSVVTRNHPFRPALLCRWIGLRSLQCPSLVGFAACSVDVLKALNGIIP